MTEQPHIEYNSLVRSIDTGKSYNYLPFYGNNRLNRDTIDTSCLSQWYPATFTVGNNVYPTSEHYMMAEKAKLFNDSESCRKILNTSDPRVAKQIGRRITHFNQKEWNLYKFAIVLDGNIYKFSQNLQLKQFLLNTKDYIIVEASPYDKIWGVGLDRNDPRIYDPKQWKGLNLLGFSLMLTRWNLLNNTLD